ncbi:GNAT family N-acetyltransferase [Streptomyces sp. NPDC001351]|uniref:GNAT family N-acetyltransferase n=1 Tax=Streptomyces sp. NPDC001351 TaxID=3364564 RepID=UPI003688CF39
MNRPKPDTKPVPACFSTLTVNTVTHGDPLVDSLFDRLAAEYDSRYETDTSRQELVDYGTTCFMPPDGIFVIVAEGSTPVVSGAIRRRYSHIAEVKRMWTHPDWRRRGLAAWMLTTLEDHAARLGYTEIYLSTGPRQPEAAAFYVKNGYRRLSRPHAGDLATQLAFSKPLKARDAR